MSYSYDTLYRLTSAVYTGTVSATYSYAYDPVGNLITYLITYTASTPLTTISESRFYDAADRVWLSADPQRGTTSYAYDASGNLTGVLPSATQTYRYNQRNLLTANWVARGCTPTGYGGDKGRGAGSWCAVSA